VPLHFFVLLNNNSRFIAMSIKIIFTVSLIAFSSIVLCQNETSINQVDSKGRKQGHWIKRYQDETILYDGYFKDDHPVGEFKRYYENKNLKSVLQFSANGKEASAILYHSNGNIASKGKYINQKKEGKWQFFSERVKDYLISEDIYSADLRNGISLKFYPDSTIAEKVGYVNDIRQGEWTRYYPNGSILLKSNYLNGRIDGKFETWFEDGGIEYSGQYKNDARDGLWLIYSADGTVKYRMEYIDGITKDRQMDIDESKILDSIEQNKDKVQDPEKAGAIK
jgi:antitoxin component YwqK of YwqJK toxin-antitoxin module